MGSMHYQTLQNRLKIRFVFSMQAEGCKLAFLHHMTVIIYNDFFIVQQEISPLKNGISF
jgi:hypothetical protein